MSFKSKLLGTALLGGMMAASLVVANPASAQTAEFKTKQAGDIVIRARGIAMVPDEDTYDHNINNGTGHGQLSNDAVPEVDFSYFVTPGNTTSVAIIGGGLAGASCATDRLETV